MAAVGRESSDAAAVRSDGAADRDVVATGWLESDGWREATQQRLHVGIDRCRTNHLKIRRVAVLFCPEAAVLPLVRGCRCRAGNNVRPIQVNGCTLAIAGKP